jgi:hypothetical protein
MFYLDVMDLETISNQLKISKESVRSILFRHRIALRKKLADYIEIER